MEPEDLNAYSFLSEPSVSSDGRKAVLAAHRAVLKKDEHAGDIWLMGLDDGEVKRLTFSGRNSDPKR